MHESSGSLTTKLRIDSRTRNVHHEMGLFDECLNAFDRLDDGETAPSFEAKYCTVFFDNQQQQDIDNESLNEAEPVENMSNFVKPSVAFCIPSSCTASDLRSAVAHRFRHRLHLPSLVSVTSEDFCYTRDKIKADSKFGIGGICTMYVKDNH